MKYPKAPWKIQYQFGDPTSYPVSITSDNMISWGDIVQGSTSADEKVPVCEFRHPDTSSPDSCQRLHRNINDSIAKLIVAAPDMLDLMKIIAEESDRHVKAIGSSARRGDQSRADTFRFIRDECLKMIRKANGES